MVLYGSRPVASMLLCHSFATTAPNEDSKSRRRDPIFPAQDLSTRVLTIGSFSPTRKGKRIHNTRTSITSISVRITGILVTLHSTHAAVGLDWATNDFAIVIHFLCGAPFMFGPLSLNCMVDHGKISGEKNPTTRRRPPGSSLVYPSVRANAPTTGQNILYDRKFSTEKVEISQVASPHHTPLTGSTNPWNRGTGVVG